MGFSSTNLAPICDSSDSPVECAAIAKGTELRHPGVARKLRRKSAAPGSSQSTMTASYLERNRRSRALPGSASTCTPIRKLPRTPPRTLMACQSLHTTIDSSVMLVIVAAKERCAEDHQRYSPLGPPSRPYPDASTINGTV